MIEARGLVKRYGSTIAVDDLSFDVMPGTVTGFLGPNGAGKSTTMRMMLGLDRPTPGRVRIGGQQLRHDLRQPAARGRLAARRRGLSPRPHRPRSPARWRPATRIPGAAGSTRYSRSPGWRQAAGRQAGGFSLGMRSGSASPPRCSATRRC